MKEGKIKFYNERKGFGFITKENDEDIFFHASDINKFDTIKTGDKVEFVQESNKKGPKATSVRKV